MYFKIETNQECKQLLEAVQWYLETTSNISTRRDLETILKTICEIDSTIAKTHKWYYQEEHENYNSLR